MKTVLGIDLAGPANPRDTCAAVFREAGCVLRFHSLLSDATDTGLLQLSLGLARHAELVVGIDAPLSYNPGGGDRPADRELRERVVQAGLAPGSVMAPTMTRMAFLTLRGIALARALQLLPGRIAVVEVHPWAALALRAAPAKLLRELRRTPAARQRALKWLGRRGLRGAPPSLVIRSPHALAACAAAWAAWKWSRKEAAWLAPACPPWHPFDFAC